MKPDRLREVLAACTRGELLELVSITQGVDAPKPDWEKRPERDLIDMIEHELRYQGSSNLAFWWRRVTRGPASAGVPYEEIVEDLVETTNLNRGLLKRVSDEVGDPLYAQEFLFSMLFTLAHPENADGAGGKPGADFLKQGLKAVKSTGYSPYKQVVQIATTLARAAAGKGLTMALKAGPLRSLSLLMGPIGTGLFLLDLGRTAYSLQGPNAGKCALAVAAVGALRMKYMPLPPEKLLSIERMVETVGKECRECAKPIEKPEEACLLCWVGLHERCGSMMERLDTGQAGPACGECRRRDLEGEGLLMPATGVSPGGWLRSLGYRAQVLNNRLDRSAMAIQSSIQSLNDNAQQLREDVAGDLRRVMRSAFGYLYVMFFTTVFLTLFGITYYKTSGGSPTGAFNPGAIFRASAVVMMAIPVAVWFLGALWRAMRNRRREDFESRPDGRRLGFRDYLFGFLYYENPIENIWGPIALIGTTVALLMFLFLRS